PYIAKVFSESPQYRVPHLIEKRKDGVIFISFARVLRLPVTILMKALGITRDKDIMKMICGDEERFFGDIYMNLYETSEIKTQEDALEFIGKKVGITQEKAKKIQRASEIIDRFLFPHIGNKRRDRILKAYFLSRAVRKLLKLAYGMIGEDDKDHYANKRLRLCGDLMESLFRVVFRTFVTDIKYNFERLIRRGKLPPLETIVRSQLLTSRIRSAMATGEWVGERTGVCQALNRLNQFILLSQLRRVVSLLTTGRENFEARDVHPTHYGRICPAQTPEGTNVGLRKHLALMCEISTEPTMKEETLLKKLEKIGLRRIGA
ncbi:MAG TPA: DNA-directed RNA polymerase subunit B'', partial [Candidatus Aenigmarchaeota archaeon]|nr:DNA-directed RNA polymerase subunit B'' [Candidatus Aenigmarchaeota archaeon]